MSGSAHAFAAFPGIAGHQAIAVPTAPIVSFAAEQLSFEQLIAVTERLGINAGQPAVIALYRRWIAGQSLAAPHLHLAWFNLGAELSRAGDALGAIAAYQAALRLRPDFAIASINLGLVQERCGDDAAALQTWNQATQPDEMRTALINQQARLLEKRGRLQQAEVLLRTSLLTNPAQPDVVQHWVHIRQKMCLWPVLPEIIPGLTAEQLMQYSGPLATLAITDDVCLQTAVGAGWIERKTNAAPMRLAPAEGYRHDRIRIGYMSSDFCSHALSYLIAELFERHDRARFDVYGYCASDEDGSAIRRRVIGAFDHFRSIRELSEEDAARLIARDEIDILVDLNGLTRGARLQVLRWRPAPVQCTYLGFVGPVPVPELDYLFCDDFVVPPESASRYAPEPLAIAANYQANDSKREIGPTMTRSEARLPDDAFVFCCFSNHYKITPEMFACWAAILHEVQTGVLWLTADNEWSCENLQRKAAEAGIDPARLIFAGRVAPAQYMARLGVADIFLDTFPYNAGTIASDAIRKGLPLVTLAGEAFASRMAARLLAAVGAEDGITTDRDAYVRKAIELARDPERLAAYKRCFTEERWAASIGDIGGLTAELEDTLTRIAKRPD